jgi:hypothetical protein
MEESIINYLLQQAPVIVLMGLALWWVVKRLERKEQEMNDMSKEFIKVISDYQTLASRDLDTDREIRDLLKEIRDYVRRD